MTNIPLQFSGAQENLRIAEMAYNAGSYKIAYDMLEHLAHYAVSTQVASSSENAELQRFKQKVAALVGQFSLCKEEALWEKSCELLDLLTGEFLEHR